MYSILCMQWLKKKVTKKVRGKKNIQNKLEKKKYTTRQVNPTKPLDLASFHAAGRFGPWAGPEAG